VKKNDVRLGTLGGYDGDKEISQFCPSKQQIQQLESLYANKKILMLTTKSPAQIGAQK
jgi:hypothetical protein